MPSYEKAPPELVDQLQYVMQSYHPRLHEAGVTVDLLLALRGEKDDYAVKAHGYGALATVRITPLKDRVKGLADSEIVLDGDQCDEWTERELWALLDHELTHLELVVDKSSGNLKRDDINRPKLAIRLHDKQMGWFDEVAQRWEKDSAEVQQAVSLVADWEFCGIYLPGFNPMDMGRVKQNPEGVASE